MKKITQLIFSISLIHKDICYALDIAKEANFPPVITSQILSLLSSAKAHKLSEKDFSSIVEIYKKLGNIEEEK
ncbi:MAG: NAD-binding protein [Persephonella sp.]|nr:NAD-binding protein [Persephonella sp.]